MSKSDTVERLAAILEELDVDVEDVEAILRERKAEEDEAYRRSIRRRFGITGPGDVPSPEGR